MGNGNLDGYDANDWEPTGTFEPLPDGEYKAIITESGFEETKAKDGEFLKLTLQIVEGKHEGRKLFDRLNLKNKSEQAVQIARGTLSAICRAVGKMTPKDSSELHNIPLTIKVAVDGEYNRIKSYKALNGGPASDAASKPSPAPSPAGSKAPWAKK